MHSKAVIELIVLFTISGAVFGASVAKKTSDDAMVNEFSVLQKVYDDCQENEDFGGCLKGKALTAISRAVDQVGSGLKFGEATNVLNWMYLFHSQAAKKC